MISTAVGIGDTLVVLGPPAPDSKNENSYNIDIYKLTESGWVEIANLRDSHVHNYIVFAPLTTRSSEQYERIKLFKDTVPELALSANGGILYENGKKSQNWFNESKDLISDCYSEFEKGMDYFRDDDYVCFEIRLVDELFVFTRSSAPLTTKIVLESILDLNKVGVYNVGEKMYIFPNILTKGRAVRRLKENFSFEEVICAGDSEFDISMLNTADCALCPEQLKEYIRSENCISFDTEKQNFAEQILNYVLTERRGNI